MKLKILLFAAIAATPTIVNADNCYQASGCAGSIGSHSYCINGDSVKKTECWYVQGPSTRLNVLTCTGCQGNRTLRQTKAGQCTSLYYTECVCANGCKDTSFDAPEGYHHYVNCGADCDTTERYSCAFGYWGKPTNVTSGCSPCPEWSGVYTNSAKTVKARGTGGGKAITDCYISPGTYYDATGTFKIISNCLYK